MATIKIENMESLWYLIHHVSEYERNLQAELSNIEISFSETVDGSKGETINAMVNMMNQMSEKVFTQFPEAVTRYKEILARYYESIQDLGFTDKVNSEGSVINSYWIDNVVEQKKKTVAEALEIKTKINEAADLMELPYLYNLITNESIEDFEYSLSEIGRDITGTHTELVRNQQKFIQELSEIKTELDRLSAEIQSIATFANPETGWNPMVLLGLIEEGKLKIEEVPELWKKASRSGDNKAMECLLSGDYESFFEIYPDTISDEVYYMLLDKMVEMNLIKVGEIEAGIGEIRAIHKDKYETAPDVQLPSWYYENYKSTLDKLNGKLDLHKLFGIDPNFAYSSSMPDNEIGNIFLRIVLGVQSGIFDVVDSGVNFAGEAVYTVLNAPDVGVKIWNSVNTQGERDNLLGRAGKGLSTMAGGLDKSIHDNLVVGDAYTRTRFVTNVIGEVAIDYLLIKGASKFFDKVDDLLDGSRMLDGKEFRNSFVDDFNNRIPNGSSEIDDIISKVDNGSISLENNIQKGNYGEMKMDQYFTNQGYERISVDQVIDLNAPPHQGIDGVYYNPNGKPPYVIGEAKYGTSKLSQTADGLQMSEGWIQNRLIDAVGIESTADILLEGYISNLINIAPDGSIVEFILDESGKVVK